MCVEVHNLRGEGRKLLGVEGVENPYFRCWEVLKTVKKILVGECEHLKLMVNMYGKLVIFKSLC